ncbi:ArsR/SmtB family transcription factor [Streptomyces sp. NPDC002853]
MDRLRVTEEPDPLWEIVLSLHLLQNRQAALTFDPWRRRTHAELRRRGMTAVTGILMKLAPWASYFPDFLTPGQGNRDLETGLDRLLSTPRSQLRRELSLLFSAQPVPAWAHSLARGEMAALTALARALRSYWEVAICPYLPSLRWAVRTEGAARAHNLKANGPIALLRDYGARTSPGSDNLVFPYPVEQEVRLEDRPLTVIPSFFCVLTPVTLADVDSPPVLVQPLDLAPGWMADGVEEVARPRRETQSVARLIGATRALVLGLLERPTTTTQLATRLRLSPSTASRHASVLREAGLVASWRDGAHVLHVRTSLGDQLHDGQSRAARGYARSMEQSADC